MSNHPRIIENIHKSSFAVQWLRPSLIRTCHYMTVILEFISPSIYAESGPTEENMDRTTQKAYYYHVVTIKAFYKSTGMGVRRLRIFG